MILIIWTTWWIVWSTFKFCQQFVYRSPAAAVKFFNGLVSLCGIFFTLTLYSLCSTGSDCVNRSMTSSEISDDSWTASVCTALLFISVCRIVLIGTSYSCITSTDFLSFSVLDFSEGGSIFSSECSEDWCTGNMNGCGFSSLQLRLHNWGLFPSQDETTHQESTFSLK